MGQWFLLNWIDAIPGGRTISRKFDPITGALAYEAKSALPVLQLAGSRTQGAFKSPVFQGPLPASQTELALIWSHALVYASRK